jgi:signal transduction histidine kinase/ActR/RegA family two-component response regulator
VQVQGFGKRVATGFFAPLLAMAVLTGVLLWRIEKQVSITERVEHSDLVLLRARDAELSLHRMQIALQGYVVSPQKRYLADFSEAGRALDNQLKQVAASVTDDPRQRQRLLHIDDLKNAYVKAAATVVKLKDSGDLGASVLAQANIFHWQVYDALEALITVEYQLRAGREIRQRRLDRRMVMLIPLLTTIVGLFLSYWGWRQIRQAEQQFADALARAEGASRAKDNFLGTISHELRNPLNSIMLWSATLLEDPNLNERMRRGLTAIQRDVTAQAQLIEDLLDVSRIGSGRLHLDIQRVNLTEVIKAGVESWCAAADAKSITLQASIDPRADSLSGDPARLQQVVWNLVSNAVKFTPKGGKVQVRVERINSHVEIVVSDNGQGIEPTSLPFVFDRFWQAQKASHGERGVGLGLAIVKEIVALHGGTVSAHSDGLGKGATFTVRLPLSSAPGNSHELRRFPTVGRLTNAASMPRLDGASILVVDDDPEACEALENLLSSLGAHVTTAISAQTALAMVDVLRPDAVVSDLGMPVYDGYFLAQELRKRDAGVRLPLVALTAYGRAEDRVRILAAGFDGHVVKPVDPAELATLLRTLLTSRTAA